MSSKPVSKRIQAWVFITASPITFTKVKGEKSVYFPSEQSHMECLLLQCSGSWATNSIPQMEWNHVHKEMWNWRKMSALRISTDQKKKEFLRNNKTHKPPYYISIFPQKNYLSHCHHFLLKNINMLDYPPKNENCKIKSTYFSKGQDLNLLSISLHLVIFFFFNLYDSSADQFLIHSLHLWLSLISYSQSHFSLTSPTKNLK